MRIVAGFIGIFALTASATAQTTYTKEISRLVQDKCQQCHQPNAIAPMALLTYDDVSTYAGDITRVLKNGSMPPWKPVAGYGEFRHSYGMTEAEKQMFLAWIAAGMPQGDVADLPAPLPVQESPWQLGKPDLILQTAAYTPPPDNPDTYRCFSLPTGLTANQWINASQALPGAAQEVHHVLLLLDQSGDSAKQDGADGQPGYDCYGDLGIGSLTSIGQAVGALVGSWVPGSQVNRLDDGIGTLIPGNARIVMQVHYHPNGKSIADQTSVGFYFSPPDSVKHRLISLPLINTTFKIPANERNYEVDAKFSVPFFLSGKAVLVLPHMHLLGTKTSIDLTDSKGNVTPLVRIDNWDFNWQGAYMYKDLVPVPANSTLTLRSFYDNSDQNPRNPNYPVKAVKWGEGTTDEMCLAIVGIILDNEGLLNLLF